MVANFQSDYSTRAAEPCSCSIPADDPASPRTRDFHLEHSDPHSEAWEQLEALIDRAADDGRDTFDPSKELADSMWQQIVTLPASIAKLTEVRTLWLYGSNLVSIPPQIGEMTSLEAFDPYTSRRLHWFPFEITHCAALRDSRVSTRHLYGNFRTRLPFPSLPAALPVGSVSDACSVCRGSFPPSGPIQAWVTLRVATDALPLLVQACSEECIATIPAPPEYPCQRRPSTGETWCYSYPPHPHQGGAGLQQPACYWTANRPHPDRDARSRATSSPSAAAPSASLCSDAC